MFSFCILIPSPNGFAPCSQYWIRKFADSVNETLWCFLPDPLSLTPCTYHRRGSGNGTTPQYPQHTHTHTHLHVLCVCRRCKMPPGITDRDILQYMWVKKNRKTDTTCVVLKDATHPKFPELEGFIRY